MRRCLLVLLSCLWCTLAAASPSPAPGTEASAAVMASADSAELLVAHRPIFTFRTALFGASPKERAERARELVEQMLAQDGPLTVQLQPNPLGQLVLLGNRLVFVISPGDVDPLRQETLNGVATAAAAQLERVVAETREASNLHAVLLALLWSGLATLWLLLMLWGLARLRRWLAALLLRLAERKVSALRVGNVELIERRYLYPLLGRLLALLNGLLVLLLCYRWLSFVLLRFPYTRPWGETLNQSSLALAQRLFDAVISALPGLGVALVIFFLARLVVGLVGHVCQRLAEGGASGNWLNSDTLPTTRRLLAIAIWLFALAMAYPYLPGAQTEAFKGLSVLLGLMVTLGASSIVGQGAAGLILTYTRTFRPGDYVQVGEHEGTVQQAGMFTTRIRTGTGIELTLPNALIAGSVTRNYSRRASGGGVLLETSVSIGYDTPWRQVEAMLLEAAGQTPGILSEPPARVYQTALQDFYPVYRLVVVLSHEGPPRVDVLSALHARIQDVFNHYGVQIMSPHYMADSATPKVVAPQDWHLPPASPP
ncbi:mechanosensitive ion channel [Paludibacterium sp. THUN1379]|uniref:mechanosensitive ion channel family protein n=1 Tax=Paludibacterium sp. THUN1379 TaxID=3112107 RepID=UPI003087F252|nr:mechanosensitive ion channel [Paludibacterium sp. THUN1379]